MKKLLVTFLILFAGSLITLNTVFAQEDTKALFSELTNELRKAGVSRRDIKGIGGPVKNLLQNGAAKENIKSVVLDLTQNGVRGKYLQKSINSMNDLVNDGENPKVAGNIVSQAAHSAQLEGLKGKDLAARVHAAIQKRKQERETLKQSVRRVRKRRLRRQKKERFLSQGGMRKKVIKGRGKSKDKKWVK